MNRSQSLPFPNLSPRAWTAVLVLATALAHLPGLRAGFIWDDAEYVTSNLAVIEPGGIARIWTDPDSCPYYYPTTFSVFWLQHRLWGLDPLGYHFVNLALHILNACLIVVVFQRLRIPFAWFGGLVFALHPVQSASVAWVTELKNVLSETLYLVALLLWMRGKSKPGLLLGASAFVFLLGMLAKPVICSFPVVLCLFVWWKGGTDWRRDLMTTVPFFAIASAVSIFTLAWEADRKITVDSAYDLTAAERLLLPFQTLAFYLGKLAWPAPLAAVYPKWEIAPASLFSWAAPLGILAVVGLIGVGMRGWMGRGPLIAVFGAAVSLGPILGWINFSGMVYSHVYTHHLYHTVPFFAAVLAASLDWIVNRPARWAAGAGGVAAAAILVVFGVLTWEQACVHRSGQTLFEHNVSVFPEEPQPRIFLGEHFAEAGELEKAVEQYEAALSISPSDPQAHFGMAEVQARIGSPDLVLVHLEQAVEGGPTFSAARFNLAWAYRNRGDHAQAVKHFSELIQFRPSYWSAYLPLAESLLELGRVEGAVATLERVLEIRPEYADAEYALASILLDLGEIEAAVARFEQSLRIDPDRGFRTKPEFARLLVEKSYEAAERGEEDLSSDLRSEAKRIWPRVSGERN